VGARGYRGGGATTVAGLTTSDIDQALALYAAGFFPMDDPEEALGPLPFYAAEDRAIFELDAATRDRLRRRVRRSLRAGETWSLQIDSAFGAVLHGCAAPRTPRDGVWLTPRLAALYGRLHVAGYAHSFEIYAGTRLAAGMLAVLIERAAMLESMTHWVPHAGNVLVARTLDHLASAGYHFADLQMPTEHTLRLGARLIGRAEYERRLHVALAHGRRN
jgi:leucyl/phenylalanyl-tRNA--protein transferase